MSTLAQVLTNYESLKRSWDGRNVAEVDRLLQQLKLSLIQLTLMPTEGKDVDQKVIYYKTIFFSLNFNFYEKKKHLSLPILCSSVVFEYL